MKEEDKAVDVPFARSTGDLEVGDVLFGVDAALQVSRWPSVRNSYIRRQCCDYTARDHRVC